MTKSKKDVHFTVVPKLSWGHGEENNSLESIGDYATQEAGQIIDWYLNKKNSKKRGAIFCRFFAILLTTVAALIPLFSEITIANVHISPVWASVALVFAAALIGLDRFFGFSTSWMRFLTTELKVRQALHEFLFEWEIKRIGLNSATVREEQIRELLVFCKSFIDQLNSILKEETEKWIQEFSSAINELDQTVKLRAEALKQGGVNVSVSNGDQCADGWDLALDGGAVSKYTGKTAAMNNLEAGTHTLSVHGEIIGKKVQNSSAFVVTAGKVANVDVMLE